MQPKSSSMARIGHITSFGQTSFSAVLYYLDKEEGQGQCYNSIMLVCF